MSVFNRIRLCYDGSRAVAGSAQKLRARGYVLEAAVSCLSTYPLACGLRNVVSCSQGPLRGIWLDIQCRPIDGARGEQHEGLASGVGMRVHAVGCRGAGFVACPRA
ncbi:hypothetical protein GCM10011400_15440 [Paraburkholderia caffeinilytica]|uniref:Uncharacterized protein n=1 Tax=Paraburkholderia caffeinilytica TaxID=1761016 RepID=A0ABQ1LYD9_9BURK|nr:hypothetical protein GCM10011400_15440 [Paraburkholderia caffeinilytica]